MEIIIGMEGRRRERGEDMQGVGAVCRLETVNTVPSVVQIIIYFIAPAPALIMPTCDGGPRNYNYYNLMFQQQ